MRCVVIGWRLHPAAYVHERAAERKLANGTLWHAGGALMAWCVGNLKVEPTATGLIGGTLDASWQKFWIF